MKRLIAWALALAMILAVMPVSVLAEGEMAIPATHSHSAAQHKCEHCGEAVTWTAWTSTTSLPTTAGHYYLTADVKISAQAKLTGTTEQVICLNGYTINANSKLVWYLQDTAKLTVSDCTAYTDSEGVSSLTLRFSFVSSERTLTKQELAPATEAILGALAPMGLVLKA